MKYGYTWGPLGPSAPEAPAFPGAPYKNTKNTQNRHHWYGLLIKTDSAQSSSNKCKNYWLKIYSQHINFLNTI